MMGGIKSIIGMGKSFFNCGLAKIKGLQTVLSRESLIRSMGPVYQNASIEALKGGKCLDQSRFYAGAQFDKDYIPPINPIDVGTVNLDRKFIVEDMGPLYSRAVADSFITKDMDYVVTEPGKTLFGSSTSVLTAFQQIMRYIGQRIKAFFN